MRVLKENLMAGALYLALLLFSQQFALFYQVQPVIWPVSAVFFAVALAYGLHALILPFFCSFVYISLDITSGEGGIGMGFSMVVSLAMVTISFLRVIVLKWLFTVFIGPENSSLSSPKMMIRFLVICGPIGGLLGALLVIPAILTTSELTPEFQILLFLRWCMAMTTGGLIFTPMILMLLRRDRENLELRRTYLTASVGATIMLLATLTFVRSELQSEVESFNERVSTNIERAIKRHFDEISDLTNSLATSFEVKRNLSNQEFQSIALSLNKQDTNPVDFLSYSPIVLHRDRTNFENQNRCALKEVSSAGLLARTEQTSYLPIKYLYPQGVADQVLCLDLLSEDTRRQAVYNAINQANSVLSKPLALADNSGKGILLVRPVQNAFGDTEGILSAVVNFNSVFNESLKTDIPDGVYFRFFYLDKQAGDIEVFSRPFPDEINLEPNTREIKLDFLNEDWRFEWQPRVTLMFDIFNWRVDLFATLGALLVILVQYISHRLFAINQTIRTEVKNKTEQLEVAKLEAEVAAETKGQFLANMSHEIRTPLNAILGFAELAKSEKQKSTQQEYLDGIWSSSEALLSLINDILDFSKIEARKLQIHPVRFNVEQIAKRLEAIFAIQIENKGLKFNLTYDKDMPYDVFADDARIQQVILNLVSNAVKFTNSGYIRVAIHVEQLANNAGTLRATIEDTGIGISEAEQTKVFEEFRQADASITRQYGGTGLGLTISNTLASLMKGELTLRSEVGKGTTFQLTVPVEIKTKQIQPNTTNRPIGDNVILIVDDNIVNLKVTEALLRKSGLKTEVADDGYKAIDAVKREKPDLILMDMQMPGIDGLETTRRIRELYGANELTIVGLTANATSEDRANCLDAGMNDHLSKPISLNKLSNCLTVWLT